MTQSCPAWFQTAIATPFESHQLDHQGIRLHYRTWGNPNLPGLLLVHGGGAHAHWWTFLAPLLMQQYYVVALDLSGHGESDHRPHYAISTFATDALAVSQNAGFKSAPIFVGHSMGGLVSLAAAATHGELLKGAIIVDSPVRKQDPESREGQYGRSFRSAKVYPTLEEALKRFRLVPNQPCENSYIIDHIAKTSLKQVENGWTWKFDPNIFVNYTREPLAEFLPRVTCRIAMMRGEFSTVVPPETGRFMYENLNRSAPLIEIPQAHHHLILDQPLAFIAALRAVLADWEHSDPRQSTTHRKN